MRAIIVINGRGGCGKDTIMNFVLKKFRGMKISSIDPIKDIARVAGWNGEKDLKSRKFLSDLKRLVEDYNDLPLLHMMKEIKEKFLPDEKNQILFTCIREPYNIYKFVKAANELLIEEGKQDEIIIKTLLVERKGISKNFGNKSDDDVENYSYDLWFGNMINSLENLEESAICFFSRILENN